MNTLREIKSTDLLETLCSWGRLRSALWLPPLLALLLYLPTLRGGLVWDDPLFLHHPLYRAPVDWVHALGRAFVLSPNYFRPLAVASFLLTGAIPWLNHLLNALLHAMNTALVTLVVARLHTADEVPQPSSGVWLALAASLALAPPAEQRAVRASVQQTSDPTPWLRLSELLLANDDAQGALQALGQAEALGASRLDVAVGRSAALIALGRLDQAEALLQAALVSAPEDARLYHNLGLVAQGRGDTVAARSLFERAADLAPEWELPRENVEALEP
ncbi:MAG: tetratricopeptide repeat protein [Anaerolineae bacterium]